MMFAVTDYLQKTELALVEGVSPRTVWVITKVTCRLPATFLITTVHIYNFMKVGFFDLSFAVIAI